VKREERQPGLDDCHPGTDKAVCLGIEDLARALPADLYRREPLPYEAAFLAGKSYPAYRRRGGRRSSPLPDFYIGARAALAGHEILTGDAARCRSCFPTVVVIAP
jgi:predicted nucleic acid-binding protein